MLPEPSTDPLAELCAALERGEAPTLAWAVAHARDGSIQRAWDCSRDAVAMATLAAPAATLGELAQLACACVRTTLDRAGSWSPRLATTLATVERWTRDAGTNADELRVARARAARVRSTIIGGERRLAHASQVAYAAALCGRLADVAVRRRAQHPTSPADAVSIAMLREVMSLAIRATYQGHPFDAFALDAPARAAFEAHRAAAAAALAPLVRAHFSRAPSLVELLARARGPKG